jgi:hypothetical protein
MITQVLAQIQLRKHLEITVQWEYIAGFMSEYCLQALKLLKELYASNQKPFFEL